MTSWPRRRCVGNHLDRRDDVREVRVLGLAERRRDADVDGVEVGDRRPASDGGAEFAGLVKRCDLGRRYISDVRLAAVDGVDLSGVEVDTSGVKPGAGELDGERQTDVAEADDANPGGAVSEFVEQGSDGASGRDGRFGHGV